MPFASYLKFSTNLMVPRQRASARHDPPSTTRGSGSELGLGDRFRFLGYRRDIHDILAAADLFVLGSAHEGLPVAMMEAFAAGLPVVATAVGGLPDAVTEGVHGRLVPPHDSAALADAVVGLVRDQELRATMSAAVRERSADYDIRTAVAEQERTYAELEARRRAGREQKERRW